MGSKPNFFPVLRLPDPKQRTPDDGIPGPVAGGLVGKEDEVLSVYVWVIQNGEAMEGEDGWAAAADGESPEKDREREEWQKQTKARGWWEVGTEMMDYSDPFSTKIAAVCTAVALIKRPDGLDAYWWTDAVNLTRQSPSDYLRQKLE
jgi:hypothetical protein